MISDAPDRGTVGESVGVSGSAAASVHPLVLVSLVFAIYLQRLGFHTSSGSFISAGQIAVLITCMALLAARRVVIDTTSLVLLSLFVTYALVVSGVSILVPSQVTRVAPQSLFLVVTLYAVLCFVPVSPDSTRSVFRFFNTQMIVVGLLGIAQFVLQFAGFAFFTFKGILPDAILIEHFYNVVIPLEYGSPYFKSNGMVFLEPSLFSQFITIALVAEVLLFRRIGFIAVYLAAIVVSYSGSGILTLVTTLVIMSLIRPRYMALLLLFAVAVGFFLLLASKVAPDVYEYYIRRALETRDSGSSGYLRYVTPFLLLDAAAHGPQILFGYGPGAAEKFELGYEFTVNALVKIVVDYGIFGALLFFGYLFNALGKHIGSAVFFVLCLSWYFVGGGYQLTSCVVHTMAVFLLWSAPDPGGVTREVPVPVRDAPAERLP